MLSFPLRLFGLVIAIAVLFGSIAMAQHLSIRIPFPVTADKHSKRAARSESQGKDTPADVVVSDRGVRGQSLPGNWRPFSDDSPWNTPISAGARSHADSALIISTLTGEAPNLRFARKYNIPLWVVDSSSIPPVRVRSDKIYDTWDSTQSGWSDVGVPITRNMWGEATNDGHLSIVDPEKNTAWEMSRFHWLEDGTPTCTTFNIWDLNGPGFASPQGRRWYARGGRGSGFPEIAGLLRPEELESGAIRHALVFTFSKNRRADRGGQIFIPPAARSDGKEFGRQYPIEGMRLQLDPTLTDDDFRRWGLGREARIVARALQMYGMFDGDNGGAMALQVQLLAPSSEENFRRWSSMFPGLFEDIEKIPTDRFRVVETHEPIVRNP